MRLYRVTWIDPHEGTCFRWAESSAIAESEAREVEDGYDDKPNAPKVEIKIVEVPTGTRRDLATWLNGVLSRSNG